MVKLILMDFLPWIFILIGIFVVGIAIVLGIVFSKKKKTIRIDDDFIQNLIENFGGIDNIKLVEVEQSRLKIKVENLEQVNLTAIQAIAEKGVFVTGNIVKTLFRYESEKIASEIKKRM